MTNVQVEQRAEHLGFRLEEVEMDGVRVWHWQRGQRHSPPFLNADAARSWMDEALRTASLFKD